MREERGGRGMHAKPTSRCAIRVMFRALRFGNTAS